MQLAHKGSSQTGSMNARKQTNLQRTEPKTARWRCLGHTVKGAGVTATVISHRACSLRRPRSSQLRKDFLACEPNSQKLKVAKAAARVETGRPGPGIPWNLQH